MHKASVSTVAIISLISVLLSYPAAQPDVIHLQYGKVEGIIVEETDAEVFLDRGDSETVYSRGRIRDIDRAEIDKRSLFYPVFHDIPLSRVAELIEQGADVNEMNQYGRTPLMYAVRRDNLGLSKLLIRYGADVNPETSGKRTPLWFAIDQGNKKIVQILLKSGAKLDCGYLRCPNLELAISRGDYDIVEILIEHGANVNATAFRDNSLLYMSAINDGALDIAKLLIDKGAKLYGEKSRYFPLHRVISESVYGTRFVYENKLRLVEFLLECGADIEQKDFEGNTPLMQAVKEDCPDIVGFLLSKGANVNARNYSGETILTLAKYAEGKKMLEMLKDFGVTGGTTKHSKHSYVERLFNPNLILKWVMILLNLILIPATVILLLKAKGGNDTNHLRLLAIAYYISGTTYFLFILPFAVWGIIAGLFVAILPSGSGSGVIPLEWIKGLGIIIAAILLILAILLLVSAFLVFLTGRSLARRKRYKLCSVVAVLSCFGVPYGTILGICTLKVLGRSTVKTLFAINN